MASNAQQLRSCFPVDLPRTKKPARTKKSCLQAGDIAPTQYDLMKCTNVGGANLLFFQDSPLKCTRTALGIFGASPYTIENIPREYVCQQLPNGIFETPTADSSRYSQLIGKMLASGLLGPACSDDTVRVVLPLFAVIKDPIEKTARPIENGRAVKQPTQKFELPSPGKLIEVFHTVDTQNLFCFHADYCNYYFQLGLKDSSKAFHYVYAHGTFYRWNVCTMGWCDANRIAESFTLDACTRGVKNLPKELLESDTPAGLIVLPDKTIVAIVYDSILVVATRKNVQHIAMQIDRNSRSANLILKYAHKMVHLQQFEWCGFELKSSVDGLWWRLAPSTLFSWQQRIQQELENSLRSVWAVCGMLTFAQAVLMWPTRRLARFRQFQVDQGKVNDEQWDTPNPLCQPEIQAASEIIRDLKNDWCHRRSRVRPRNILYGVFDATPQIWSWSSFDSGGTETAFDSGFFESNMLIDDAEATACCKLLRHWLVEVLAEDTLILCGGDNRPVLQAFVKGTSACVRIKQQISESRILETRARIVMIDIPSKENYADIRTRPDQDSDANFRLSSTISRLHHGLTMTLKQNIEFISREFPVVIDVAQEPHHVIQELKEMDQYPTEDNQLA